MNLFAGDLDGADHTALRREQAALYAFNALKTAKVAYSPNAVSYTHLDVYKRQTENHGDHEHEAQGLLESSHNGNSSFE